MAAGNDGEGGWCVAERGCVGMMATDNFCQYLPKSASKRLCLSRESWPLCRPALSKGERKAYFKSLFLLNNKKYPGNFVKNHLPDQKSGILSAFQLRDRAFDRALIHITHWPYGHNLLLTGD